MEARDLEMEKRSSYLNQPKGIPHIAHMNEDLTFTIVAAGKEQVERYRNAASPEDYLAGEEVVDALLREREGKPITYSREDIYFDHD